MNLPSIALYRESKGIEIVRRFGYEDFKTRCLSGFGGNDEKEIGWNQRIMLVLIVLSVLFAVIQLVLFHDTKESVFLFLQDLIFLPINILLVTFILDRIIQTREKQEKLDHMNIVIGAFFGEIGNDFLRLISENIAEIDQIRQLVDMNADWSDRQFDRAAATVTSLSFTVVASNEYLQSLKQQLPADRMQLTRLFENPNLLEHDSFTDTLWSVYHLMTSWKAGRISARCRKRMSDIYREICTGVQSSAVRMDLLYETSEKQIPLSVVFGNEEQSLFRRSSDYRQ
jgi:hypothetical protein